MPVQNLSTIWRLYQYLPICWISHIQQVFFLSLHVVSAMDCIKPFDPLCLKCEKCNLLEKRKISVQWINDNFVASLTWQNLGISGITSILITSLDLWTAAVAQWLLPSALQEVTGFDSWPGYVKLDLTWPWFHFSSAAGVPVTGVGSMKVLRDRLSKLFSQPEVCQCKQIFGLL